MIEKWEDKLSRLIKIDRETNKLYPFLQDVEKFKLDEIIERLRLLTKEVDK